MELTLLVAGKYDLHNKDLEFPNGSHSVPILGSAHVVLYSSIMFVSGILNDPTGYEMASSDCSQTEDSRRSSRSGICTMGEHC